MFIKKIENYFFQKKPLSHVKTTHSYPIFKCLIPIYICYLFEFKYFNYIYQKNTKYKITSSKKKKPTTSHKNYLFLSHIQISDSYMYLLFI